MVRYGPWVGPMLVVVLILSAGYLVAYPVATSSQTVTQTQTVTLAASSVSRFAVNLAYKAGIGFYLTNASGFTLYFRSTDPGNGSSTCTGQCVVFWPLFYAAKGTLSLPPNLSAGSFGTATRSDGKNQTTFDGYPLYYYANDKAPGQVNGQGKSDFYASWSYVSTSTTTASSSAP